ncbi:MAG: hypothetical protein IPI54_04600 [Chitinophagaceae bacterium]|nr:hypothetical protein [Chitinophagaceae bacterium]
MQYITIYDYVLLPVYLFIFYILVKRRSLKIDDIELRKIFLVAFGLRMFGSVAFSLMVQYYYGYGDSFTYYTGSSFLTEQVKNDLGNIKYFFAPAKEVSEWFRLEADNNYIYGYLATASNLFVMKMAALISLVSFNKFLIISLFFGLFSFAGQWKLFRVFHDINMGKNNRLLAFAVLYTPSIWFWGSGLMKDSICIGAAGFIIAILYKNFIKKQFSVKDMLVLAVMFYIVNVTKSYIALVLVVGLATFIFARFMLAVKNIVFKAILITIFFFAAITLAFVFNFDEQLQELAEESSQQVESFQKNYNSVNDDDARSKGMVEIEEIDASLGGILLQSPVAIFTCLFRPFIWESRKLIILFNSLEATLLFICTLIILFKTRFFGFFRYVFNNEYVLFCFIVSMLFGLVIGLTTFNYGSMARYKIILLPFYYFMLVHIYTITMYKNKTATDNYPELCKF